MHLPPAPIFGGNILNKKEYAYTTGTLGTPTDTIVYTYDSVWKDKLLSYDGGATITYDAIGNPLTYNGYTFTWPPSSNDGRGRFVVVFTAVCFLPHGILHTILLV